jgi:signal transduction histidine kinase
MLRGVQQRMRRVCVAATGGVLVAAAVAALGLLRANAVAADDDLQGVDFVLAAAYLTLPLVGVGLLWMRPAQPVARLLVASGLLVVGSQLAQGWAVRGLRVDPGSLPGGEVAAWLATWAIVPGLGLGPFVLLLFPDGHVARQWVRRYAVLAAVALGLVTVAQAFAPDDLDGLPSGAAPIHNPLGVEGSEHVVSWVTGVGVACVVGLLVVASVDLVLRFRRAEGDERQQLRWMAAAGAVLPVAVVVALFLDGIGQERASEVAFTIGQVGLLRGLSVALAVAVLRHRLYDLDLVLSRSLLYGSLTLVMALGYVAVVALVGLVVSGSAGPLASLVAAGAVALAFQPARLRLQRAADRVVRGTSGEPYAALAGLGARLAETVEPTAIPEVLVTAVVRELRVPYAALVLDEEVLAERGVAGESLTRLDVVHQGARLATLVVGSRPGRPLRMTEHRLLRDLARQAGAALHVSALAAEVQHAREQAVVGREEERRRLRRELHDGVGPALAGLALQAGALRQRMDAPVAARLEAGLAQALEEVRRTARDLRPAGLDEVGLAECLRQLADRFAGPQLQLQLDLPEPMPPLPAATEVALVRIAGEALSNVARHAGARHCRLSLAVAPRVVLEVQDDGVGGARPGAGVGLSSMRERAEEIGGSLQVDSVPGGGTLGRAQLGDPA